VRATRSGRELLGSPNSFGPEIDLETPGIAEFIRRKKEVELAGIDSARSQVPHPVSRERENPLMVVARFRLSTAITSLLLPAARQANITHR